LSLLACDHVAPPNAIAILDATGRRDSPLEASGDAKTVTLTVTVAGKPRIVIVHSPANAPPLLALVLNLHGSGGSAAGQEGSSGMDQAADAHGFLAAYPQGVIALASGFAWNVPGQPLLGGQPVPPDAADDVAFIAQAIAAIEQAYPIDPKRVYVAGMSGGARMASQLGCDLSTLVAAVAPVAGLRFPSPCNAERPVPVIAFHGTADTVNPYDGGGQAYWTYSVPSAAQQWAAHNGCRPTPSSGQPAANVRRSSYEGCSASADVDLYTIDGAGHEWPGAPGQTNAIDANAAMWAFFQTHRL
jgi:polyhydroxybutyrate depolymerase